MLWRWYRHKDGQLDINEIWLCKLFPVNVLIWRSYNKVFENPRIQPRNVTNDMLVKLKVLKYSAVNTLLLSNFGELACKINPKCT